MGTTSITNNAVLGDRLAKCGSVSAAYANDPIMPAPPVPEDQADIVFLKSYELLAYKIVKFQESRKNQSLTCQSKE